MLFVRYCCIFVSLEELEGNYGSVAVSCRAIALLIKHKKYLLFRIFSEVKICNLESYLGSTKKKGKEHNSLLNLLYS